MTQLNRHFGTFQQALDVYRSQIAKGFIFIEYFEALPRESDVTLVLNIQETQKQVTLHAIVERMLGKRGATEAGYGTNAGVIVKIPLEDHIDALRSFFVPPAQAAEKASPKAEEPAPETVQAFLERTQSCSLYQVFSLNRLASSVQIRDAYQALVRRYHPDSYYAKLTDDELALLEEAYQVINDAYEIISHPVRRQIYDTASRQMKAVRGLSLENFLSHMEEHRQTHSQSTRKADNLSKEAAEYIQQNNAKEAHKLLALALGFDPYHYESLFLMSSLKV